MIGHETGRRVRPVAWPAALVLASLAAIARADDGLPPDEARRAATLAAEAANPSEPLPRARLLLRAQRWDRRRLADLLDAIRLLEPVDPVAALRHAGELLNQTETLPEGADAVLRRVARRGSEVGTFEAWRLVAAIRHRLAAQAGAGGASLWLEAGLAYDAAGEVAAASEAFEQEALAVRGRAPLPPATQRRIVAAHLVAQEPLRAAAALQRLAESEPDATDLPAYRARLALLLEDPLAAIEHARQACAAASHGEASLRLAAGRLLIEALNSANQPALAPAEVERAGRDAPADATQDLLRVEALLAAGLTDEAARTCQALLATGLAGAPGGGEPDALAELAAARLSLARTQQDPLPALGLLPALADRLGSLDPLAEALAQACHEGPFRRSAADWCKGYARRAGEDDLPAGTRRAALRVAIATGETRSAATLALARLDRLTTAGVDLATIVREARHAAIDLLDANAPADAEIVVRGALDRLDQPHSAGAALAASSRAPLKALLAEAIALQGAPDPRRRAEAMRLASDAADADAETLDTAIRALRLLGDHEATLRALATRLRRTFSPDGPSGDEGRRDALWLRAAVLAERGGPGDRDAAIESLELALDGWPADAATLATLADWLAEERGPLARADRMALRAVELAPKAPRSLAARGGVLVQAGRTAEGQALLEAAVDAFSPDDGLTPRERDLIRRRLAAALGAQGRAEEAAAQSPVGSAPDGSPRGQAGRD